MVEPADAPREDLPEQVRESVAPGSEETDEGRSASGVPPAARRTAPPAWSAFLTPLAILVGSLVVAAAIWFQPSDEPQGSQLQANGGFTAAPTSEVGRSAGPSSLLEAFTSYATDLGLDLDAFRQCLGDSTKSRLISEQLNRGRALGVNGTPTFFINNKKVVGAQPPAVFDEIIEKELRGSPTSLDEYSEAVRQLAATGRFAIVDAEVDTSDAVFEGSPSARVVIAEFSDFQCPFCKQWSETYLPRLRERLGDEIALAYLHFPITEIHPAAPYASLAAICAGEQGRFWEMHDRLFERQSEWAGLPPN